MPGPVGSDEIETAQDHSVLPLRQEWEENKAQLQRQEAENQERMRTWEQAMGSMKDQMRVQQERDCRVVSHSLSGQFVGGICLWLVC